MKYTKKINRILWRTVIQKEGANWRWSIETAYMGVPVCTGICKSISNARRWMKLNLRFIQELK